MRNLFLHFRFFLKNKFYERKFFDWLPFIDSVERIILDDWMRDALSLAQSQDLLDILNDRYGRASTIVVTQVPVER